MQIFELHFNPKLKEDKFFDSFIYEPSHSSEKRLGSLYIVGELTNGLPSNLKFLDNLAQAVKSNYYKLSYKNPEKALTEDLKKANQFLSEEVKKENVSWLGNLNFAVLSLKDYELAFAKTGEIKIILIRAGQITDIGKNLDLQEIEPYPLKVFFSVVSGKLLPEDIILVLTKELFDFFIRQNILNKISQIKKLNRKELKEILPDHFFNKGEGINISGACLIAVLGGKIKEAGGSLIFQKEEKLLLVPLNFLKKKTAELFLTPFALISEKIKKFLKIPNPLKYLKKIWISLKKLPTLIVPRTKVKKEEKKDESPLKKPLLPILTKDRTKEIKTKNRAILVIILICLLSLGFFIFKKAGEVRENKIKIPLNEIEEKLKSAENFITLKNEEKAQTLLKEAWLEIIPLTEKETSSELKSEIASLKESIWQNLKKINKIEEIKEPEEVSGPEYQKLFVSPALPENLVPSSDPNFNPDLSALYLSNLYLLDKKTCKIIKYPSLGPSIWGSPQIWKESDERCSQPKSMAIDGSIWLLNSNNSISRYHKGEYQETINLYIFPDSENIAEIETKAGIPYLYLLEPSQKRLIIIEKETKQIFKQFQSEKFDNLKDLAISEDGKTIYLLNGNKIYKIEL